MTAASADDLAEIPEWLPPTQHLVMEVLAARHRLGELHWPLPQSCRHPVMALATLGLVEVVKDHDVMGWIRVRLTERSVAQWLDDSYTPGLATPGPATISPGAVMAGQRFQWVGLPGQYDPKATITLGSATAAMQVNATVDHGDGNRSLVTIGAADLAAALEQGWLRPLPTSEGSDDAR